MTETIVINRRSTSCAWCCAASVVNLVASSDSPRVVFRPYGDTCHGAHPHIACVCEQWRNPAQYSCEGTDISPPLQWFGSSTRHEELRADHRRPGTRPDPRAPKMTWVHWVVYNIPADLHGLPEGAAKSGLPPAAKQGLNDWKRPVTAALCPPIEASILSQAFRARRGAAGSRARDESSGSGCDEGHVIAETQLVGTYERTLIKRRLAGACDSRTS